MFELIQTRSGAWGIRSQRYQEVCHPGAGPAAEARALYVEGLQLPARLAVAKERLVIWDIGLGGAANAMAAIHAVKEMSGRLQVVSFDWTMDGLAYALEHADALGYFGDFAPHARSFCMTGRLELAFGGAELLWEAVLGDFAARIRNPGLSMGPSPDLIFFDPHSPSANPEMWTLPLFEALHRRLDPARPASLATYSRSTAPRVSMLLAGFYVGKGGATGFKEETTLASTDLGLLRDPLGSRWLARARRSGAAEPWTSPPYRDQPLSDKRWEQLRAHPQFQDQPAP
ncbi:MAG: hypothetical protein JNK85_07575 [Verrucomicrobiales bacterium]|nr:hypothetical protein [Verrucomicrobiales bacterium]